MSYEWLVYVCKVLIKADELAVKPEPVSTLKSLLEKWAPSLTSVQPVAQAALLEFYNSLIIYLSLAFSLSVSKCCSKATVA